MIRHSRHARHHLPMLLVVLCLTLGLGLSPVADAAEPAAPLRVLLPPTPGRVGEADMREPLARARVLALTYLADWLGADPGVALVDPAQAGAILGYATGPAWMGGRDVHGAVNAILPVDAVLTFRNGDDGTLVCTLYRAGTAEPTSVALAYGSGGAITAFLKDLTAFTATGLRLVPQRAPTASTLPMEQPQLIEDAAICRYLWAEWMSNSGEARLTRLMPYQNRLPADTFAAAAMLDAASWLTLDNRKVTEGPKWVEVVQQALFSVLGTEREASGIAFSRVNKLQKEAFETELLRVVAKLSVDALEADFDAALAGGGADTLVENTDNLTGVAALMYGPKTPAQQASAVRFLGVMQSAKALPHLRRIATAGTPALRLAAAWGLAQYTGEIGIPELQALAAKPETAFVAAHGLWQRGQTPANALALARAELAAPATPSSLEALAMLAALGTAEDVPALQAAGRSADPARRAFAVQGLLRLDAVEDYERWLADPDGGTVIAALAALPATALADHQAALSRLANSPEDGLAEAARLRLGTLLPQDATARALFELQMEHPYVRRQLVEAWAAAGTPEAVDALVLATTNPDPQTRALARLRLATTPGIPPARAREGLLAALADPHRMVRLYAAGAAAQLATSADLGALQAALADTDPRDAATRLYLADAIARAEGKPLPAPPKQVNRVSATINQSFNCGWTVEVDASSFDGFYGLHMPKEQAELDAVRRAHDAGKIFLPRANGTAKNPAQALLTSGWRDGFWLGLDAEFGDQLDLIDGVVLGEESMYFRPWQVWDGSWRLFCREAGLDPSRVHGDREQLTAIEKAAFLDWEERVAVEGFNAMVGYIRLRYGKLRPGFQVATFMPDQNGPGAYDLDWDFDIAAGYYYAAGSRLRYAAIRRMKTLWPERPVLWLNQGKAKVGLGLNTTNIGHKTPVPETPFHALTDITSVDSLTTWMAGGHTGLFSIYLFVHVGWKGEDFGKWVQLEDVTPTSPVLKEALDHSFRGLGDTYKVAADIAGAMPTGGDAEVEAGNDVLDLELIDPATKADPFEERAQRERAAFTRGFLLERRFIQNPVNLLSGAPFPIPERESLLVGPRGMNAPGFDLLQNFDCVFQINKLAGLDLSPYSLLGVSGQDAAPLQDGTITAISSWLKERRGLLYVHGWLPVDNASEAPTAQDLDGTLAADWPWEGALTPKTETKTVRRKPVTVTTGYTLAADAAAAAGATLKVLAEADGVPTLVFWRGPGMKGGVLFDAGSTPAEKLQPIFYDLRQNEGVGPYLEGWTDVLVAESESEGYMAAVSTGKPARTYSVRGVDALTGVFDPELDSGRAGILVAREWRGTFSVAALGMTVLADTPLSDVAEQDDALSLRCEDAKRGPGLMQVVGAGDPIVVSSSSGRLPLIPPEEAVTWMYQGTAPGVARLARPEHGEPVLLVRGQPGATLTFSRP